MQDNIKLTITSKVPLMITKQLYPVVGMCNEMARTIIFWLENKQRQLLKNHEQYKEMYKGQLWEMPELLRCDPRIYHCFQVCGLPLLSL